jgi:hypothetical protein
MEQNNNDTAPQSSNIPKIANNPLSYYGFAWRKMWKYFLELLLVAIVSFLIFIPSGILFDNESHFFLQNAVKIDLIFISFEGTAAYFFFALVFVLLLQWPLEYGISYVHLKAARDEKIIVKDMFAVFDNYWNSVFANLLVAIIIGFGIVFFIIPGLVFACKLAFVPYLIVDKKMEAVEAVKESWKMTTGYGGVIFLTGFLVIFVALLGLLFLGIGIIISIIWIKLAFAAIYFSAESQYRTNEALVQ